MAVRFAVLRAWIQASRPLAQANIAVPLVFGQALAWATTGSFDWAMAGVIHLFGVFDQLFIVYANDVADLEGDTGNTNATPFSGGSRVLVEGKLTQRALGFAAVFMALAMLVLGIGAVFYGRPHAPTFIALSLALLWAYSFPPLRLSYRGEGEVLQGLGIGIVLPVFAYYMQAGRIDAFPMEVLAATFLLGYGGNVTTALPDYAADLAIGKRTIVVRLGELPARWVSVVVLATACFMPFDTGPSLPPFVALAVAAPPILLLLLNIPGIGEADAENRPAVIRFVLRGGGAINALLIGWSIALVMVNQ
jgi:1,4-dihydroxy-2-naphthoate octaprenyltransferase